MPLSNSTKAVEPPQYLTAEFLDRVKRSYCLAIEKSSGGEGPIWPQIDRLRRPIHEALISPGNKRLRDIFADPITTDLFYGVDNLAVTIDAELAKRPHANAGFAEQARNLIVRLAHALGVIRWVPNDAEQFDQYVKRPHAEPIPATDDLLDAIERKLGYPILFPTPFRGERGVSTSRGVASYRAIAALYQGFRLTQETRTTDRCSVLEIGPGMGRTAYYAVKAGIERYVTIDLPMGIVAQACFLGATLGADALWMLGDHEPSGKRVRLLPGNELHRLQEKFGVVLNVDSLTEMGDDDASRYASWIAENAATFLSINHEANELTIPILAKDTFASANCYRFPYWMRPGYAEEIFRMPHMTKELATLRHQTSSWHRTARRFASLTLDRLTKERKRNPVL
jgi:hypothetical protein